MADLIVYSGRQLDDGELVTIRWTGTRFELSDNSGLLLAACDDARKLSGYAFGAGASAVSHRYDLKLSDR